jgi:hypothetical protein
VYRPCGKVSGAYDYMHNAPYFGFQVQTTQGISSPANANGLSIRKTFEKTQSGVKLAAEVEATVVMGETRQGLTLYHFSAQLEPCSGH